MFIKKVFEKSGKMYFKKKIKENWLNNLKLKKMN